VRIGVVDSVAYFRDDFFIDKNIIYLGTEDFTNTKQKEMEYTHSELVVASILKQNPEAEIILNPLKQNNNKYLLEDLKARILELLDWNVQIINLSLGIENEENQVLKDVIDIIKNKAVYVIASYANNECLTYPAAYRNVLGVYSKDIIDDNEIFTYDKEMNNVHFKHQYTDFYHLGLLGGIEGNSFLTGTMTGIISSFSEIEIENVENIIEKCRNLILPLEWIKESNILISMTFKDEMMHWNDVKIDKYLHIVSYTYEKLYHILELEENKEKKNLLFYLSERNKNYEDIMEKIIEKEGKFFKKVILTRPYFSYYNLHEYMKKGIRVYQGGW